MKDEEGRPTGLITRDLSLVKDVLLSADAGRYVVSFGANLPIHPGGAPVYTWGQPAAVRITMPLSRLVRFSDLSMATCDTVIRRMQCLLQRQSASLSIRLPQVPTFPQVMDKSGGLVPAGRALSDDERALSLALAIAADVDYFSNRRRLAIGIPLIFPAG